MSRILSAPDPAHPLADADFAHKFYEVADAAARFDGYAPFNEQCLLDLTAQRRTAWLITGADGTVVGAAVLGQGELDLTIAPEYRRQGHGRAAFVEILATAPEQLTLWSHGDHPAARALAADFRFVAARTLLELRLPLEGREPTEPATPGAVITAFRPGLDEAEWLALNALTFAAHPEQGSLTRNDLEARQHEAWFDAADFLTLRAEPDGAMIGYNWLKVDGTLGEIYVLGVHPSQAGHGFGRALMQAGLNRLAERGCTSAALYVEADSEGPVHLYRALGFTDHTVDVQYHRLTAGSCR